MIFLSFKVEKDDENIWSPLLRSSNLKISSSTVNSLVFDEGQSYYPVGDTKILGDN